MDHSSNKKVIIAAAIAIAVVIVIVIIFIYLHNRPKYGVLILDTIDGVNMYRLSSSEQYRFNVSWYDSATNRGGGILVMNTNTGTTSRTTQLSGMFNVLQNGYTIDMPRTSYPDGSLADNDFPNGFTITLQPDKQSVLIQSNASDFTARLSQ